jgi:hypothetical protein
VRESEEQDRKERTERTERTERDSVVRERAVFAPLLRSGQAFAVFAVLAVTY